VQGVGGSNPLAPTNRINHLQLVLYARTALYIRCLSNMQRFFHLHVSVALGLSMSSDASKRLVFVLGAGSSVDFKFPMGSQLTSLISTALDFREDAHRYISGGNDAIREALSIGQFEIPNWFTASKLISSAMPLAPSIDNFVDVHRNDMTIAYCAKVAIAGCILRAERNSSIYINPDNIYNTVNFKNNVNAWHTLFFRIVTMYCTIDDLICRLKSIAIVTFNYDRSFETFLFYAVKTYYRVTNEIAAQVVNSLEIYHPYGKVGKIQHLETGAIVSYGKDVGGKELLEISKQIRTFTEGSDPKTSDIQKIRSTIFNSGALVFLGFAFHPLNVDLLFGERQSFSAVNYDKKIYGTAFGSSRSDLNFISWDLRLRYNCDQESVELRNDLKCDQLFNEYSRTLSLND
jgi:hypothetical protein